MVPSKLKKEIAKRLKRLPASEEERATLEVIVENELAEIKQAKIHHLFEPTDDTCIETASTLILESERKSVVGRLVQGIQGSPVPWAPIRGIEDFLKRLTYVHLCKMGTISDRQIVELILAGTFGDPKETMATFWKIRHPDKSVPTYNYEKELAVRLRRVQRINLDDVEQFFGIAITPYEGYLSPGSSGERLWACGQLQRAPKQIKTKQSPPQDMAFLDLYPLGVGAGEHEDPRINVTVWPGGFHHLGTFEPPLGEGDVVLIHGIRGYNNYRHTPQLEVSADCEMKRLSDAQELGI